MKVVKVGDAVAFKSEKMNKVCLFDTERFFCDVYCLEPGQTQKVHAHEGSDKIYYVLNGSARITVGAEENASRISWTCSTNACSFRRRGFAQEPHDVEPGKKAQPDRTIAQRKA